MGTLVTSLVILAVAFVILGIRMAVRSARRQAREQGYRDFAAAAPAAFPLAAGETVVRTIVARTVGATRTLENDSLADEYPDSFPMLVCTNHRLVLQMALSDRTSDIVGSRPPRRVDLRRRIGEQFTGDDRTVSSCAWDWTVVDLLMAGHDVAGISWADTRGRGGLIVTYFSATDRAMFEEAAVRCIVSARSTAGIEPADAIVSSTDGPVERVFVNAAIICSDCGTTSATTDAFCTGCGLRIWRPADGVPA